MPPAGGEDWGPMSWADLRAAAGTSEHQIKGEAYLTVFGFWLSLAA